MWTTLKELMIGKEIESDILTYEIKKFTRKKLNKAFKAYIERDSSYKHLSFKRAKVKLMKDWGIDEYTAYHISEAFDDKIKILKGKVEFPKRGKNIPEDLLMKMLGNMNIDANWFFTEGLNSPVRFLDNELPQNDNSSNIKNEITIPVYNDLKQLTDTNPLTVGLTKSILEFLGLGHIKSNEKHPIFQYYNFVFAKVNNSYYLTDLWDQDLKENETFLVYKTSDMSFEILEYKEIILKSNEVFTLGRVLTILKKLVETI